MIDIKIIEFPNHDEVYVLDRECAGIDDNGVEHFHGGPQWRRVARLHPGDPEAQEVIRSAALAAVAEERQEGW